MDQLNNFNINVDGKTYKAIVVWTYQLYETNYCIYAIQDDNKRYNLHCGEIVNNQVVPLQEKNKKISQKIIASFASVTD